MNTVNTAKLEYFFRDEEKEEMVSAYDRLSLTLVNMYTDNASPNRGYSLSANERVTALELIGDGLPSEFYFKAKVEFVLTPSTSETNYIQITYSERGIGNFTLQEMLRIVEKYS